MDQHPPLVQLLSEESLPLSDLSEFKKSFLKLLPELKAQAQWSASNYKYLTDNTSSPLAMVASPVGRLDPFSNFGHCSGLSCRRLFAQRFGQSFGLYAENIFVSDRFTQSILHTNTWNDNQIAKFAGDIQVLQELLPLIKSGIIRFQEPEQRLCRNCYEKFDETLIELVSSIWNDIQKEIIIEEEKNGTVKVGSPALNTPLVFRHIPKRLIQPLLEQGKTLEQIAHEQLRRMIQGEVRETFLGLRHAVNSSSVVLADSRVGLSAAMELEHKRQPFHEIEAWELDRSATLPWVSNLSLDQIIQLRQEAANALPRLREQLATALCIDHTNESTHNTEKKYLEWVRRLREESSEVEAELKAIGSKKEKIFHNSMGVLGLGISIYCFAESQPLVGSLTSLFSTLSLIHSPLKKDQQDEKKLKSRPGYVLVKAREILAHAHD